MVQVSLVTTSEEVTPKDSLVNSVRGTVTLGGVCSCNYLSVSLQVRDVSPRQVMVVPLRKMECILLEVHCTCSTLCL